MRFREFNEPLPNDPNIQLRPEFSYRPQNQGSENIIQLFKTNPDEFNRVWLPRIRNLDQRIAAARARIERVLKPHELALVKPVKMRAVNDVTDYGQTYTAVADAADGRNMVISFQITLFWDAPDNVLLWVMAHELGHIRFRHSGYDSTQQFPINRRTGQVTGPATTGDASAAELTVAPKPAIQSRNDEFQANSFANSIMLRMGITSANAIQFFAKSQADYAWSLKFATLNEPGVLNKQEEIDQARLQGFQLSQGAIQHLNHLKSHLA